MFVSVRKTLQVSHRNELTLNFYAFLSVNTNELLMSVFWYRTKAVTCGCSSAGNTIEM